MKYDSDQFVHLHCHTSYSILDGAAKIPDQVAAAVEMGMPGLAITDHGNLHGIPEFYRACKSAGINPILGSEIYFTEDATIKDKTETGKQAYHLSLMAINNEGYLNLMKLSSLAYLEGFWHKPRVDWAMLEKHHEGLIATTGCLGGIVLQKIMNGDVRGGELAAARLQDIFGAGNLYVELQDHGMQEQNKTNPILIEIAKMMSAPIISTNDSHYVHHDDHVAHDSLLCQPPGTMVSVVDGHEFSKGPQVKQVPIEDVSAGDRVVSWVGDGRHRIKRNGDVVTLTGSREYNGMLFKVTTDTGKSSSYTDNHLTVVSVGRPLAEGNHVVYLMRQGERFRIGSTTWLKDIKGKDCGKLGLAQRMDQQNADAAWVLGVFDSAHRAQEEEYFLSQTYNVPTWSFANVKKSAPRTPYYASLWDRVGSLEPQAKALLADLDLDIALPLATDELLQRKALVTAACNLLSGFAVVDIDAATDRGTTPITTTPILRGSGSDAWRPVTVEKDWYSGPVYSLDVDDTHTYFADGILTHNCVQTHSKISDPDRFKFASDQHYLKSASEMRGLFPTLPQAANNTLEINQRANVTLDFDSLHLPKVNVPSNVPVQEGVSPEGSWLALMAGKGLQKRYGDEAHLHAERLQYELTTVESLGLSAYFLIVWDICRFADQNGVARGPGRGSAAGSLISYCMNVTKVDPMRFDLMFERFLNPSRIAMPDIDLDFSPRDREKVINYITEKYGQDQVSQIVTFSTIKARSAVRDSARVLGFTPKLGDTVAKLMPDPVMGFDAPLYDCMNEVEGSEAAYRNSEDLRKLVARDAEAKKVVDVALGLEGLVRQTGTGAAGVLITPGPVTDYVPVQTQGTGDNKHVVTQYDKNICEDLGLVKMDILGLRNLDVLEDCLASVKDAVDFESAEFLEFNDGPTFDLLRKGDTIGVFQLESSPMQELLRAVSPNTIDDIAAVVALYRPGPMGTNMHYDYANRKNGRQQVAYFHPEAEEILGTTYGLMVYQEQAMLMAQKFCGYTGAEADNLRKIIGKKLLDKMELEKSKMMDGAVAAGYGAQVGEDLFDMIESFAAYAFNAAHAVSYGYISYQTAYMKANYPVEYMAALADSFSDDLGRCAAVLAEARRMGIEIIPANVRHASGKFMPAGNSIMVGMNAIKFLGSDTVESIMEWQQGQPADMDEGLASLLSEVPMNLREMNALASAGALDKYGPRRGLILSADELLSEARRRQKDNSSKQNSLFDSIDYWSIEIPDIRFTELERLQAEKDVLGLYISGNPVSQFPEYKTDHTLIDAASSPTEKNKSREVLCVVMNVQKKKTRAGGEMAIVTVGDEGFTTDVTIFPRSWAEFGSSVVQDSVGIFDIATKADDMTGGLQLVGRLFMPVKESVESRKDFDPVEFRVPRGMASNDSAVSKLKGVLASYPGDYPVEVQISEKTSLDLKVDLRVHPSEELFRAVSDVFTRYSSDRKMKT